MKEKLPQNYYSSDKTIQSASDRTVDQSGSEKPGPGRTQRRRLGDKAFEAIETNPEILETAHDLARDEETGRVDYGRILREPDGSVTVYNNRAQRDSILAERAKKSRRRH